MSLLITNFLIVRLSLVFPYFLLHKFIHSPRHTVFKNFNGYSNTHKYVRTIKVSYLTVKTRKRFLVIEKCDKVILCGIQIFYQPFPSNQNVISLSTQTVLGRAFTLIVNLTLLKIILYILWVKTFDLC